VFAGGKVEMDGLLSLGGKSLCDDIHERLFLLMLLGGCGGVTGIYVVGKHSGQGKRAQESNTNNNDATKEKAKKKKKNTRNARQGGPRRAPAIACEPERKGPPIRARKGKKKLLSSSAEISSGNTRDEIRVALERGRGGLLSFHLQSKEGSSR